MHLIIAGHGKQRNGTFDPGATGLIKKGEHRYVVEDLFPAMRKHLPNKHNLVFFSNHKVSNYGDIVSLARKYKAKQITEIHFDSAGATATGGHVIIHRDYAPDKVDLALRDAINDMVGLANRTHRRHKRIHGRNDLINVNLTRNAKITYRLIELGYGASNKRDADILVNRVDDYAKALVKALVGDVKQVADKSTSSNKKPNAPYKSNNSATSAQKSTYKGNSIVEYLQSIRQPSSFNHRKKLASKHGIKNYTGTATQNLQLLRILRDGAKVKPTPTKPKPAKPQTFRVGQKVKIKSSAKKYSRANVTIPSKYKNKSYTIQQVGKNDVLIKELYSWVRKSDLQ